MTTTAAIVRRVVNRGATLSLLRQHGLSLVELMVGLTIGLLLTVGLVGMIAGTSRSFAIQDDFARIQENGSLALHYLGDDIRMAGFYGMAAVTTGLDATRGGAINTVNDCGSGANPPTSNWALAAEVPLFGYTGATAADVTATFPCIDSANVQAGQVLAIRRASGYLLPDPTPDGNLTDAVAAQPNYQTTLYVQSESAYGLLFRGRDYAAIRADNRQAQANGVDAPIFEYFARVYYIRPCSRPVTGSTRCTAAADGGRPIPTLARQELSGSTMVETPVVEGIERISFLYGIDTNGNGVPDRFVADPVAAGLLWADVVSVRVALLARSPNVISGYNDGGKTYDLDGDGTVDYFCTQAGEAAIACSYKRKVFVQTFQMRNVAMRRGA